MGKALINVEAPITKGCSGIVTIQDKESRRKSVSNCIKCAKCITVCPMGLLPYQLSRSITNTEFLKCQNLGIENCIECGSCSYICPSSRPLLDNIRLGKIKLRELM